MSSQDVTRDEAAGWVAAALRRMRLPAAPPAQPWDFSASALLASRLPGVLRWMPGVLDRFGAVRLASDEIGIDATRSVRWSSVVELRTRPLLDVLSFATSDNLSKRAALLIPRVPLLGRLARRGIARVADRTAEMVLSIMLLALGGHAERASSIQVPVEIVYRTRWGRHRTMTAGLVSSAVLSLPEVTASVVATARLHDVPISSAPQTGRYRNAQELADKLRERRRALGERRASNARGTSDD